MKILMLASSFSGLCQRVLRELMTEGHTVEQHYGMDEPVLREQLDRLEPDLVVCPFLIHRIPDDIWQKYDCLVVHPGIEGDRGPSSLDWAISSQSDYWGVTLLQAAEEMDAGDIWGTAEFPLRAAGKTSTYKREVSTAAVKLIMQAIEDAQNPEFKPRPLDYRRPEVKGTLLDKMVQADRAVNWDQDATLDIIHKIHAADTSPGLRDSLFGQKVFLYGAIEEPHLKGEPGEIIAVAHGAVCRATKDGAIWIRQMKCKNLDSLPGIKLPAADVFKALAPAQYVALEGACDSDTANDIRVALEGDIAYVHADFYNGAASTEQCVRLRQALVDVKHNASVKTIVMMGGEDFFSNGIHLNCIEAAKSPAQESWLNINAIDDVVRELIDSPNHLTVAALRNNAGAGGAILALACDKVVAREGVTLNPHYDNMGLFGSEYWTYLLPKRVGAEMAEKVSRECKPMLAKEALELGFADVMLEEDWDTYHRELRMLVEEMTADKGLGEAITRKRAERASDEAEKPLALYREEELAKMYATFFDPNARYHYERRNFVYKGKIPVHLQPAAVEEKAA